jgi:hypothetical protein
VRSSNHNDHDIITDNNDIVADEHKHRDWIWDHSRSEHWDDLCAIYNLVR